MDVDEVMPAIEETDEAEPASSTFIAGVHKLGPDEILEPDDSVYLMRHSMNVNWPCLSFDVLRDVECSWALLVVGGRKRDDDSGGIRVLRDYICNGS